MSGLFDGSIRRVLAALLTMACVLALAPQVAQAGTSFNLISSVPTNVTVGQRDVGAVLTFINQSQSFGGEVGFETDSYNLEIVTLVLSCGSSAFGADCPVGSQDTGVLVPAAAPALPFRGRAGTACANVTFTAALTGPPTDGKYEFTPSAPVTLGPNAGPDGPDRCIIDYSFDVMRLPALDSDPGTPGTLQTDQKGFARARDISPGVNQNLTGGGLGTSRTTVNRPQPAIATFASAPVTLGAGTLSDNATLSGLVNPVTTGAGAGTVEFRLYGPGDTTCTVSILPSPMIQPLTYNGANTVGTATAFPFTPTQAGVYRWRAFYSGDANNAPVSGSCNDANEQTVVTQAQPALATVASAPITLGAGTLTDTATVSGLVNPVTTGGGAGAVEFRLYAPGDTTCTLSLLPNPIVRPLTYNPANTVGTATSTPAFTPTQAGTYRWRAFYSGDANNNAVSGACNIASENTVASPAQPAIATVASPNIVLGSGTLTDQATVSGLVSPVTSGPGAGTVEFRLYGPADTTCATPILTRSTVALTYNAGQTTGSASSAPGFTPTQAGVYRWRAFYSGDANNLAVSGTCNDPSESTVVTAAVAIETQASPNIALGSGTLTDQATVTGLTNPGAGSVEFRLYEPGDTTCSLSVFQSTVPLTLNGAHTVGTATSTPAFTPTRTGTYRWRAFYSGDANNPPANGACNLASENTVVSPALPVITTVASPNIALGAGTLTDTATVTGLASPVTTGAGAGSVEFRLYGPGDPTCTTPIFTRSNVAPAYNAGQTVGVATSAPGFTPTQAGVYRWRAFYSGDANNNPASGTCNDPTENTSVSASPVISTVASADIVLGAGTLNDSATVTGLMNAVPSGPGAGTVEFRLYDPGDTNCSSPPIFQSVVPLTLNGAGTSGTATSSPAYTPTKAGTHRWRAFYSGDVNNAPASGTCNEAAENTVVARATPAIATTASPDIVLGSGALTDVATVTGLVNPVTSGAGAGSVEFRLYAPGDVTCTSPLLIRFNVALTYNGAQTAGTATSAPAFTPSTAGTYRWRALYNGDANNNAVSGACNAPGESTVVSPAGVSIDTQASADIALGGGTLSDQATVSGLVGAVPGAGTVEFRLYGPGDTSCATAIFQRSVALTLNEARTAGTASSAPGFTPSAAGTYRWRAFYSGDANNNAVSGPCDAPNERTAVAAVQPSIETVASPGIRLGAGSLTDQATVSGLVNAAGGTVEFRLYGPGDTSCLSPVTAPMVVALTLNAAGTAGTATSSPPFTPTLAGTYRWRAFYSGDANNNAVSGACNAPNESVVVTPGPTVPPPPPPPRPRCLGKVATIVPGAGQTVVRGTAGADVIVGTGARENIDGRGGNDTICAGGGADTVRGGAGGDDLRGGDGADLMLGGAGDDDLRGDAGADRLGGGDGRDRVDGGTGSDQLDEQALGGRGRDRLLGGAGIDRIRAADRTIDNIDCGGGRDVLLKDPRDLERGCERVRVVRR